MMPSVSSETVLYKAEMSVADSSNSTQTSHIEEIGPNPTKPKPTAL